jgi:hypothetical protein
MWARIWTRTHEEELSGEAAQGFPRCVSFANRSDEGVVLDVLVFDHIVDARKE